MSVFSEFFKGKSTHAQPVETKEGSWKAELDKDDKRFFNMGALLKGAALVGIGVSMFCPLSAVAVVLVATAAGSAYASGVGMQAITRSYHDKKGLDQYGLRKPNTDIKNLARYSIQPF